MIIRKYKRSDAREVARVISSTFQKFNSKGENKKAVAEYVNYYSPKRNISELEKIFARLPMSFVAEDSGEIIGVIRGLKGRVTNLFVLGKHHGKGVASALLDRFERVSRKEGVREIKIKSSPYAIGFYQKKGYKKTTGIRNLMGLKVQPMKKAL